MNFFKKFVPTVGLAFVLLFSAGCAYRIGDPLVTNVEVKKDEAKYGRAKNA
ncbi:hypothetical protein [Helicobacter sp. CLO-3]|uniref:hypothetical protein n=2 Tax=unclassified Helicobacter TaxID=2593540 RepID=UPI0015A04C73|nr:hypothetical protein [Helicobacter sp. CLO-3]